jgi:hypothetical protein
MTLERQILYNFKTSKVEQDRLPHRWTFVIVNTPYNIEEIKQKIYENLQPVDDLNEIGDYPLKGTNGLHCVCFSISSSKSEIEREAVYNSLNFREDRRVKEMKESDFSDFVERTFVKIKR